MRSQGLGGGGGGRDKRSLRDKLPARSAASDDGGQSRRGSGGRGRDGGVGAGLRDAKPTGQSVDGMGRGAA